MCVKREGVRHYGNRLIILTAILLVRVPFYRITS